PSRSSDLSLGWHCAGRGSHFAFFFWAEEEQNCRTKQTFVGVASTGAFGPEPTLVPDAANGSFEPKAAVVRNSDL
ncbi:hypothetical protein, partial [uncultured Shimia sp.]|uniref:hypothetical protein n=1 Tax=uncultured Shimia sp. TaxID=573152 RepID=UPI00260C3BDD